MSTPTRERSEPVNRRNATFWCGPILSVLIGAGYLVACIVAGKTALGIVLFALMCACAAAIVVSARYSETLRGLMDHRDERLTGIDRTATMFAGLVLIFAVLGGFIVSLAQGHDGDPYSWLAAVTGVSYLGAVIYLRIRH
jgi:4-hydroxybenzoate polyprenyltransferase